MSWESDLVTQVMSIKAKRPELADKLKLAIIEEFFLRGWGASDINAWIKDYGRLIGIEWKGTLELVEELANKPRSEMLGLERVKEVSQQIAVTIPELLFGTKFNPSAVAEKITNMFTLKGEFIQQQGQVRLWMFDQSKKIWIMNPEKVLEETIRFFLPDKFRKTHHINEVINDVASRVLDVTWKPVEEPPYLIPFNNCILDLRDLSCKEYSKDYFFVNKIAWDFKPELIEEMQETKYKSGSMHFDILFSDWGQDPAALTALLGYTFHRDYPIQKAFFMVGEGANGKGTYARILQTILGKENCASESLADLAENRFSTANLWSKFINFSSEIHIENKLETSMLKQLTGGDLIRAEFKHKPPFTFHNYAKLIIMGNVLPPTSDNSLGWFRRLEIIKWDKIFDRKKADPQILDKIPQEGWDKLVVKAVLYLKQMHDKEFRETSFPGLKEWEENRQLYEKLTNPFIEFIEKHIEVTEDVEDWIPVFEFAEKFQKWILKTNHPQKLAWSKRLMNRKNQAAIVASYTPFYIDKKDIDQNKRWKVIYGVKWRDDSATEQSEQSEQSLTLYVKKFRKKYSNKVGNHSVYSVYSVDGTLTSTIQDFLNQLPEVYLSWDPEQLYPGFVEYASKYDVQLSEYAKEDILKAISEALRENKGGVGDGENASN